MIKEISEKRWQPSYDENSLNGPLPWVVQGYIKKGQHDMATVLKRVFVRKIRIQLIKNS